MTLSTLTSRVPYSGAASVGPYAFPFRILAAADLLVTKRDVTGAETTLAYPTDYTVAGVGDVGGGTVTLAVATLTTDTLVIRRAPALTQGTALRNQGPYFPATQEDAFDRIVMLVQALADQLGRSIHTRETDAVNAVLPALVPGRAVVVNGSGTGFDLAALDSSAVALPGGGRTVPTLTAYLADNASFNVKDYGAKGDSVTDDAAAINAAIAACVAAGGGIVFFPAAHYNIGSTIVVPVTTSKTVRLVGAGHRSTYLVPTVNGMTAVRFGAAVPDASGTTTNNISYCGMEDLSVTGTLLTSGNAIGVQLTQAQKCWLRNVIIEAFTAGSSIGLSLLGSTTTGVGASAAPHVWRCGFHNVVVATTMRPLVMQNVDECDFFNCNFAPPPSLTAAADSLIAVDILQGHNDRFFGLLLSGENTDLTKRNAYVGLMIHNPAAGDNLGHQCYGIVAEGFDRVAWVESSNNSGIDLVNLNASICNVKVYNKGQDIEGATNPEAANNLRVHAPLHGLYYGAGPAVPATPPLTITGATPSLAGSSTFACGNGGATTITAFSGGAIAGAMKFIRLDANTTIQHNATIHCNSGANIVGTSAKELCVAVYIGGIWSVGKLA